MDRYNNLSKYKTLRKKLRNNLNSAESILWSYLKRSQLGKKFRRQHSIDNFVLDFYCPEARLAIELDGASHDTKQAQIRDNQRTNFINQHRIKIIRFLNKDVYINLEEVLMEIRKHL